MFFARCDGRVRTVPELLPRGRYYLPGTVRVHTRGTHHSISAQRHGWTMGMTDYHIHDTRDQDHTQAGRSCAAREGRARAPRGRVYTLRETRSHLKSAAAQARAGAQFRDSRRCACRFASASLAPPARARGAASARARALRPEGLRQRCRRCARLVVPRRGLIRRRRRRYSRRGSPGTRL